MCIRDSSWHPACTYFVVAQNIWNNTVLFQLIGQDTAKHVLQSSIFHCHIREKIDILFSTCVWRATKTVLIFSWLPTLLQRTCPSVDCCLCRAIVSLYFLHTQINLLHWESFHMQILNKARFYPHMPIGMLWIYRLLFLFVCFCPQNFSNGYLERG